MKRFIALGLSAVMALSLTACGGGNTNNGGNGGTEDGVKAQTWKFGSSAGDTSTWVEAGKYFGQLMSESTDGAITVDCYGGDQLFGGSQTDGIQGVIDGTTDVDMHSNLIYAARRRRRSSERDSGRHGPARYGHCRERFPSRHQQQA